MNFKGLGSGLRLCKDTVGIEENHTRELNDQNNRDLSQTWFRMHYFLSLADTFINSSLSFIRSSMRY
jgi:hypothetical protein